MMARFRLNNPLVAIGCGQFALSLMQTMFMFYYVKVYLNVFHVPQVWFNVAQALFMVWNAVNDPLFGYLQDTPGSWMNSRTAVIRRLSPFIVFSFVFMWIPWSTSGTGLEGIHLILSLFLYDAFFSAIGVAWCALFAESTKDAKIRVQAMKYSQISILCSVNIVAITEKCSHSLENFAVFQVITAMVAAVSLCCMYLTGSLEASLPFLRGEREHQDDEVALLDGDGPSVKRDTGKLPDGSFGHAWLMTKEIVRERDFLAIIASNFIHTARSVAHMNFASTATELLIPQSILPKGSLRLSLFYAVLTLGPQILLILNERLVVAHGAYRVMIWSYALSLLSGFMYLFSSDPYIVMIFMVIDSITVHGAAPLFNIIISDFIDDDAKRNSRRSPVSSLVFSLNALFVKPAQSLAPVLIVYFMNFYEYEAYLFDKTVSTSLIEGMTYVLFATPLLLGGLQLIVFKQYTLKNVHRLKTELL